MDLLITDKIAARENKLGTDIRSNQNAELLFEEYVRQLNTLLQEINFLLKRVQSKQVRFCFPSLGQRYIYLFSSSCS